MNIASKRPEQYVWETMKSVKLPIHQVKGFLSMASLWLIQILHIFEFGKEFKKCRICISQHDAIERKPFSPPLLNTLRHSSWMKEQINYVWYYTHWTHDPPLTTAVSLVSLGEHEDKKSCSTLWNSLRTICWNWISLTLVQTNEQTNRLIDILQPLCHC